MKSLWIAVAAASIVTSGAAIACPGAESADASLSATGFVPVQYSERYSDRTARWDDWSVAINEREARINARIQRGINDGRITDREAHRLYAELRDIEAKERDFKADGRLSRRETEELNRDLDRLTDNVRAQLRDEQRRY